MSHSDHYLRSKTMLDATVSAWETDDPDRVALWLIDANGVNTQVTISLTDADVLRWKLGKLIGVEDVTPF